MRRYLRVNNILGVIVLIFGFSKILEPVKLLNLLGVVYYAATATALFKKPKIGYALLVVSVLALISAYVINYYVNYY